MDESQTIRGIASFLDASGNTALSELKRRVLVVDDDPSVLRLVSLMLDKAGYDVTAATDGQDAVEKILARQPDVLLCDWKMPRLDGVALCQWIRQRTWDKYIYIILFSGRTETRHMVEAIAAGADDFFSKPVRAGELFARMQAGLRILERERQLAYLAQYDSLTGVMNRRTLLNALEQAWLRAVEADAPLACVMLDLDHFKRVNDRYGHLVGDDVLRAAAAAFQGLSAPGIHVGRFGGEEFCAILENATESDAATWAESCRERLATTPVASGEAALYASASFGVSGRNGAADTSKGLLDRADQALFLAKRSGRNRVVVFGDAQPANALAPLPEVLDAESR